MSRHKKRKPATIDTICCGDTLHIQVPENRYLDSGVYAALVDSELSPTRQFNRYRCHIQFENFCRIHFLVSVARRAYRGRDHEPLLLFLGTDEFPVDYTHEPNLERRLRQSASALTKERKPYAD